MGVWCRILPRCVAVVDPASFNSAHPRSNPGAPTGVENQVRTGAAVGGIPNAKERLGRIGRVYTSLSPTSDKERGRNVPGLGVLRGHWKLRLIRGELLASVRSSDILHMNATAFQPRKKMFYGRINGRNFAASLFQVARAASPLML